jgi:GH15 family glucan-1,4-alpha-glucosidase
MYEDVLAHRTRLGLLSEDVDTRTGELWGNSPQTHSMVGFIHAA